jgi:protoheme ferro-lyase
MHVNKTLAKPIMFPLLPFHNEQYADNDHALIYLNNAVKNLYMEIATVIIWPFKNSGKFVESIADVAKEAEEEKQRKSFVVMFF